MTKRTAKSVCPYCGIVMEVADNKIVKVTGDKSHPTNFGRLCTKGSSCHTPVVADGTRRQGLCQDRRQQGSG